MWFRTQDGLKNTHTAQIPTRRSGTVCSLLSHDMQLTLFILFYFIMDMGGMTIYYGTLEMRLSTFCFKIYSTVDGYTVLARTTSHYLHVTEDSLEEW